MKRKSNRLLRLVGALCAQSMCFGALSLLSACGTAGPEENLTSGPAYAYLVSDTTLYDFGTRIVGSSTDKTFVIENRGPVDATQLSGVFGFSAYTFKGGSYPGTGGTCQTTIVPGELCIVVVTFAPTYAGTFNEFLNLSYFNGTRYDATSSPIIKGKAIP